MSEPLRVRWDRTVIHSTGPGDDTIVCCLDQHGRPVALFLDEELREALGLQLLLPDGDGEVDPQHLELARENERLTTELATAHAQVTAVEEHARRKADRGVVVDPNILLMILADATTSTADHVCGNCDGVDPDSCLMNPQRTTPTSKEQQR